MKIFNNQDIVPSKEIKIENLASFEELFNKYYHVLCEFSFSISKDKQLAEEAVSDVFIKLWQKRDEIEIHTNLKSYLFQSARNQTITYLRKEKNNILHFDDSIMNIPDLFSLPDYKLRIEDAELERNSILNKIPLKSLAIFKMHRFGGLKYKEIAELLGLSIKSIEKHMTISIKIINSELNNCDITD